MVPRRAEPRAPCSTDGMATDRTTDPSTDRGWASVTACPHGPLLVRGDVEILLPDGSPVPRTRSTVALCRCGASGIKPYCDGTHKVIGFRTDDEVVAMRDA